MCSHPCLFDMCEVDGLRESIDRIQILKELTMQRGKSVGAVLLEDWQEMFEALWLETVECSSTLHSFFSFKWFCLLLLWLVWKLEIITFFFLIKLAYSFSHSYGTPLYFKENKFQASICVWLYSAWELQHMPTQLTMLRRLKFWRSLNCLVLINQYECVVQLTKNTWTHKFVEAHCFKCLINFDEKTYQCS